MNHTDYTYPTWAKYLHAGLAIFGIAAWLTAEAAESGFGSNGYYLHAWLGLTLAAFVLVRVAQGFAGAGPLRFSSWSPFSRKQWVTARRDVLSLVRMDVPERRMHEGLAGLTQAFGLALFFWMSLTGIVLFLLGGGPETASFEMAEEAHEVGEALIPLYLALHVGSVLVHSLAGRPIWQRMWKFRQADTAGERIETR